jgi:hypothetical protein
MEWITRVGEYRTLRGKRDQLGCALDRSEAARLAELERFFTAIADPHRVPFVQRDQVRAAISLIVTFRTPDGNADGEARDVSGDGMFIATPKPLFPGAQTVVRVIDRHSGRPTAWGCAWSAFRSRSGSAIAALRPTRPPDSPPDSRSAPG